MNTPPLRHRAVTVAALLTALFGTFVGVGSYFRFPVVSWWFLGTLPSPLAALSFAFAGVSLALFAQARRSNALEAKRALTVARGFAVIILLFGLLVVASSAAGYELRPDLRLSRIGRMYSYAPTSTRPLTAVCFFLLGSGLLTMGTNHRGRRVYAHAAISLVASCSAIAVLCTLFDRKVFLGHETAGSVSYLASTAFLVLCAGYYFLESDASLVTMLKGNSTGAIVARRLLPAAFVVPPVVGWLSRFAEHKGLYQSVVGEAVEALVNILVFTALIAWTALRLLEADAERRKAEFSMRESEEQFSEAFEHSPIGVALVSCEGRWLKINPALCDLIGYSATELLTMTFFDITHPDDRASDEVARRRMLTGEIRNLQVEKRYIHASGKVLTVIVSVSLTRDEHGQGRYFITQIQDITERKHAEDALRESEARYQRIAANVPGMVYRFVEHADGTRALLFASEGCREIYGVDPQQIRDDPSLVVRLIHPEDQQDYLRSIKLSAASLSAWNWQGRVKRHDTSEIRSIQGASRPERQPNGDVTWDGVVVDVTERKQAEENLRAKEEAERTNLAKSKFLSRISHELRTPLNAILGFSQILELSARSPDDTLALSHILKGGRHLLSLIDEVLDLSRAESGELHLNLGIVDPDELARDCLGLVARLAETHGVTCKFQASQHRVGMLLADELRLRQILLNLLSNAIKYNRPGGEVVMRVEQMPGERAWLKVSDTGPGILPEALARLFVPFERLDQEFGEVEGTGLGLVISRQIAEAMGGSLEVESKVGEGSTFWVELPLAKAKTPLAGAIKPEATLIATPTPAQTATLLYIEDNASNLQVVQMMLGRQRPHWQFISARDGRAGLERVRQTLPGVILLDLQLPEMSGEEVLKQLRAETTTRDIPVIVLSADATTHSREHLIALGATEYISKPFQIEPFFALLDRILLRRSRQEKDSVAH